MKMDIRDINKDITVVTKTKTFRGQMHLEDYEMSKESGEITSVLLTRERGDAMKFHSEAIANDVAEKTGLLVEVFEVV